MTFDEFWEKVAEIHKCQFYVGEGKFYVKDSVVSKLLCIAGVPQMKRARLSLSLCMVIKRTVIRNMFQLLMCKGFFQVSGM